MARILIVDDSRISRRILRNILEQGGHEIVGEAGNGQEGYDLFLELKPDLVTMDITMPVMDGLESLRLIIEADPAAKVLMITAAGQKDKMMQAVRLGCIDFVAKPFDDRMVVDMVTRHTGG